MSQLHRLKQYRHSMSEIRGIMNSMKTLAYMETQKISKILPFQRNLVNHIEFVAADFLKFNPLMTPTQTYTSHVFLLLGSERGFCGGFNENLLRQADAFKIANNIDNPILLVTGHKLHAKQDNVALNSISLDGATVVEEVETVLTHILDALTKLMDNGKTLTLDVFYNNPESKIVSIKRILPPFQQPIDAMEKFNIPAKRYMPAKMFLADMIDHYLFSALHQLIYISLLAENLQRVQHLEGAVQHLDEQLLDLVRQSNALRQEEIIEEIEVILLNSSSEQKQLFTVDKKPTNHL